MPFEFATLFAMSQNRSLTITGMFPGGEFRQFPDQTELDVLNALGADGWDLAATDYQATTAYHSRTLYLRRST